jgi:integrase
MRGSINYQVQQLYEKSGISRIGQSRHAAKTYARATGAARPAEIAAQLGIHSYNTADAYRAVWRQLMSFAKAEFGLRDIESLDAFHVRTFLEAKVEDGVAHATWVQYAAACSKLENALNAYAESRGNSMRYQFRTAIDCVRNEAHSELTRFKGSRAYCYPERLIGALPDAGYRLAAAIQLESGARVHEVAVIQLRQLRGCTTDSDTGKECGAVNIRGKGGKIRDIYLDAKTYAQLERHIQQHGSLQLDADQYRGALKVASVQSGQDYQGSHGLRWNYAQAKYAELISLREQSSGALVYSVDVVLKKISTLMGHERHEITTRYLKH